MMFLKGKPMLQWNLEKALSIFDRVYVSTDTIRIAEFAEWLGAKVIMRPYHLGGETPDITVYRHAVEQIRNCAGIVAIHVNNPTIDPGLISLTKDLIERGVPEVMTCYPMTQLKDYKKQANHVYGSIRGMTVERLHNYVDPYHPNPEVLITDTSIEIETQADFDLCLQTFPS